MCEKDQILVLKVKYSVEYGTKIVSNTWALIELGGRICQPWLGKLDCSDFYSEFQLIRLANIQQRHSISGSVFQSASC